MKFKELLDILIADENLCVEVGNDEDYGTFEGKVSKFAEDERFHDLGVLDLKSVIVRDHEDGRIDDNIMSVTTELWISLYDPECKVLDDE
jgi:hypothetical protein